MRIHSQPFYKSIDILNSALILVCITYALGIVSDISFLQDLGILSLLLLIPLKVFLYCGIYGILVEIASKEEVLVKFDHWKDYVRRFWKIYSILLVVPFFIHLPLTLLVPYFKSLPITVVVFQFNIIALFILAKTIIAKKYIQPLGLSARPIVIDLKIAGTILGIYAIDMAVFYLPQFIDGGPLYLPNILGFVSELIHYMEFLIFVVVILDGYPEIEKHLTPERELYIISPPNAGVRDSLGSIIYKPNPAVFVVLKALTPKNYRIRLFNRVPWQNRFYKSNVLVAITCFTGNSFEAYKIAKEFKESGATVIMGGPHVTYLPDEALGYCDSVVIGEAEGVWKQLITDYENNSLKKKYVGAAEDKYYEEVHQELLMSSPEVIRDFLETTRGCKFKCHFCTIPGLSSGRTRTKPTFQLVELIEKIKHKYNSVSFIDNNIYSDPAYAKELFTALKPLKVKWRTACTIDIVKNEELLKLAKDSGCELLLFGYEIFGSSSEKGQGGKFALAEKYIQLTDAVKKMGIRVKGSFVFGWDTDRLRDLITLWKFCLKIRPEITVINLLTPIPGSHTYDDMLKENSITNLNWRSYSFHNFVFKHKHINRRVLDLLFPILRPFFMFTTSRMGFSALFLLVVVISLSVMFKL